MVMYSQFKHFKIQIYSTNRISESFYKKWQRIIKRIEHP